jgi:hypothetical protein
MTEKRTATGQIDDEVVVKIGDFGVSVALRGDSDIMTVRLRCVLEIITLSAFLIAAGLCWLTSFHGS